MQITLIESDFCGFDGCESRGLPELHVRVLSNQLLDVSRIKAGLTAEQAAIWARYAERPSYYFPPESLTEGFKYDDEWHFTKRVAG